MTKSLTQLGCALFVVLCFSTSAFAQVTSTLSGTVVDAGGAVIPGASVVVTNKSTTATFNAVTDGTGAFSVPALNPGLYSVSVSLSGFKTVVLDDVRLQPGIPTALKATLEIGGLEETVVVDGGASLVNTTTPVIAATLNVDQINDMPLPTRNALERGHVPPGRQHLGHQPRRQRQRPAGVLHQHHARRRRQQRQLQQDRRTVSSRR